jgi:hypothetical protein
MQPHRLLVQLVEPSQQGVAFGAGQRLHRKRGNGTIAGVDRVQAVDQTISIRTHVRKDTAAFRHVTKLLGRVE